MPFDDPISGERTSHGVYRTPKELGTFLRDLAEAIDHMPDGWGAVASCNRVEVRPQLWLSLSDVEVKLTFRDVGNPASEISHKHGFFMPEAIDGQG